MIGVAGKERTSRRSRAAEKTPQSHERMREDLKAVQGVEVTLRRIRVRQVHGLREREGPQVRQDVHPLALPTGPVGCFEDRGQDGLVAPGVDLRRTETNKQGTWGG